MGPQNLDQDPLLSSGPLVPPDQPGLPDDFGLTPPIDLPIDPLIEPIIRFPPPRDSDGLPKDPFDRDPQIPQLPDWDQLLPDAIKKIDAARTDRPIASAIYPPLHPVQTHFVSLDYGAIGDQGNSLDDIVAAIKRQEQSVKHIVFYAHGANQTDEVAVAAWTNQYLQSWLNERGIYLVTLAWNGDFLLSMLKVILSALISGTISYETWELLSREYEKIVSLPANPPSPPQSDCSWLKGIVASILEVGGVQETAKQVWEATKRQAIAACSPNGGATQLLNKLLLEGVLTSEGGPKLHLIGFSAGAIVCQAFVELINSHSTLKLSTCTLWGPGSRLDQFGGTFGAALDNAKLGHLEIHVLEDAVEVSTKSILLAAEKFEEGAELLGRKQYLDGHPDIQRHSHSGRLTVLVPMDNSPACHNDFDNADPAIDRTLNRIAP